LQAESVQIRHANEAASGRQERLEKCQHPQCSSRKSDEYGDISIENQHSWQLSSAITELWTATQCRPWNAGAEA